MVHWETERHRLEWTPSLQAGCMMGGPDLKGTPPCHTSTYSSIHPMAVGHDSEQKELGSRMAQLGTWVGDDDQGYL